MCPRPCAGGLKGAEVHGRRPRRRSALSQLWVAALPHSLSSASRLEQTYRSGPLTQEEQFTRGVSLCARGELSIYCTTLECFEASVERERNLHKMDRNSWRSSTRALAGVVGEWPSRRRDDGPLRNSGAGTQPTRIRASAFVLHRRSPTFPKLSQPPARRAGWLRLPRPDRASRRIPQIIAAARGGPTFVLAAGVPLRPARAWKDN